MALHRGYQYCARVRVCVCVCVCACVRACVCVYLGLMALTAFRSCHAIMYMYAHVNTPHFIRAITQLTVDNLETCSVSVMYIMAWSNCCRLAWRRNVSRCGPPVGKIWFSVRAFPGVQATSAINTISFHCQPQDINTRNGQK